jgi:ankyrin repeat protein
MGTWGYKTFENDGAADWLYDLEEAQAVDFILKPIKAVNQARGKADLDDSLEALAAAEVIAGARYEPPQGVPPIAKKWIRRTGFSPNDATVKLALRAIGKVMAASQLADVWQKAGKLNAWHKAVKQLNRRLTISLRAKVPKRTSKPITPRQTLAEFIIEVAANPTPEKRQTLRAKLMLLTNPNRPVGGRGLNALTPLHWVASRGLFEEAKLLVSRGAIVDAKIGCMARPIAFALEGKHYAMVDFLVEAGADKDYALLNAIQNNDIRTADKLAKAGADLFSQTEGKVTLMDFAASAGAAKSIAWLAAKGLVVNCKAIDGSTPLHSAVLAESIAAVKALVEHGANVHAKDNEGRTPLSEALDLDFKTIVRYLRKQGDC